ncbi:MAG: hypothetical protein ACE5JU_21320 [Candidatus Binatia bacterium]
MSRLADELTVSERHVREMIARGRWPVYRVGKKRLRLDPEEIRRLTCQEAGQLSEKQT